MKTKMYYKHLADVSARVGLDDDGHDFWALAQRIHSLA